MSYYGVYLCSSIAASVTQQSDSWEKMSWRRLKRITATVVNYRNVPPHYYRNGVWWFACKNAGCAQIHCVHRWTKLHIILPVTYQDVFKVYLSLCYETFSSSSSFCCIFAHVLSVSISQLLIYHVRWWQRFYTRYWNKWSPALLSTGSTQLNLMLGCPCVFWVTNKLIYSNFLMSPFVSVSLIIISTLLWGCDSLAWQPLINHLIRSN